MQIIERRQIGDVHVWSIDGGLDRTTHDQFVEDMYRILESGARKVVLDFSRLTYISSISLGTLVRVHSHFSKNDASLKFASLHTNVTEILRFAHLDRIFDLYKDVNEAVASF
ncbi:MAG: STAS domain-containing protein [Planctomycetes bacterium]|nr:STAS domain-containing protein [Planctomycetota bacterium]